MFDAQSIIQATVPRVIHHAHMTLGTSLHFMLDVPPIDPANTPLAEQIREVCQAANGGPCPAWINETIQAIAETLFSTPMACFYHIPPEFWSSELGQAMLQAQLKASGDELITLSEAAALLYPDASPTAALARLGRAIERGELTAYTDPAEANPQRARRLSRAEVVEVEND